jgi:hypothetical protein
MSIDLGRRVAKHDYADLFEAYSGVTLTIPDGQSYTAGDDSGRTIKAECPWASQQMADNLLAQVKGFRHQPYSAAGAILDPAAEMGDTVTIDGVAGKIFRRDQRFGTLYRADLSAPGDEEINHEIPYYPPIQRAVSRVGSVARAAAAAAGKAQEDILQDRKNLIAALNREDGAPEDLMAGFDAYVRWDLDNNEGFAQSTLFAEIGEKARSEITTYTYVDKDGNKHSLVDVIAKVDDTESGLATKVGTADLNSTLKNYALAASLKDYLTVNAAAGMYVTDDDVTATIGAYVVQDTNGHKSTLAAILADVIKLQGDTEILGNLSIVNGRLNVSRSLQASTVFASGLTIDASTKYPIRVGSGYLGASTTAYFESDGITLGSTKYSPQEITSTDGQKHTALGHAS